MGKRKFVLQLASLAFDGSVGKLIDRWAGDRPYSSIAARGSPATIVLIPGWEQTAQAMLPMGTMLARRTGCRVVFPETHEKGNIWTYRQMCRENEWLLKQLTAEGNPVIMVGYSRGGLNAVDFAQRLIQLGMSPGQITLISIATPWHGSPLAYFTLGSAGREMRPGHPSLALKRRQLESLAARGMKAVHWRFAIDGVVPRRSCHECARVMAGTFSHYCIHRARVAHEIAKQIRWLLGLSRPSSRRSRWPDQTQVLPFSPAA